MPWVLYWNVSYLYLSQLLPMFLSSKWCAVLQSGVIASERFANQVRLDEAFGIIRAQLELEPLSQARLHRGRTSSEAGHLRVPAHHGHEIDDVVGGATESCAEMSVRNSK